MTRSKCEISQCVDLRAQHLQLHSNSSCKLKPGPCRAWDLMPRAQGGALKTCGPVGLMTQWTRVTWALKTLHPYLPCGNQRAKGAVFLPLEAPIPGHTPQLGPMGTGQQVASDDKVWCSVASQGLKAHLPSFHSACPKRGRVGPFLRKPRNTLFSGLNAQILVAVTGHT